MKKIVGIAMLTLVCGNSLKAQEIKTETTENRKNEVMLSPIELIAYPLLNLSYERLINQNSGVGINGMFLLKDDKNLDDQGFSQVSPYYRMYFGKKYASGFFVEGFVPITTTKDHVSQYTQQQPYYYVKEVTRTTFGVGIGFGGKWITRNNILFEVSGGIARRFGDKKSDIQNYNPSDLTGKGLLGIGYRF